MIEMSVGIEDGYGVVYVVHDPFHSPYSGVDDEVFSLYRDDIAVGLICPHRSFFYFHFLSV